MMIEKRQGVMPVMAALLYPPLFVGVICAGQNDKKTNDYVNLFRQGLRLTTFSVRS